MRMIFPANWFCWRTGLLFAATLFMLFIMGYILVMIIAYALNRNMTLQSLIENKKRVAYSDISSFFIKNNSDIGVGIDSNKFTTTFIYNIRSKKIVLN